MTIKLDPPPVPPLTPSQRAHLRDQVMQPAVRRTPRRWVVPVAAVAAVGAIIAGATLAGHWGTQTAPPVTNTPVPDATKVDAGPASAAELNKALKSCRTRPNQQTQGLWSRKVVRFEYENQPEWNGVVALMKVSPPVTQPGHLQGIVFCLPTGRGLDILDSDWSRQPTPAQGLVTIYLSTHVVTGMPPNGEPMVAIHYEKFGVHRVRPEIVRIQARLVRPNGTGRWFEGVVLDGIAYTDTHDNKCTAECKAEYRAFDKHGNPVPLQ